MFRELAVLSATSMLIMPAAAAAAMAPRPNFLMPFTCGESWALTTYKVHKPERKKIDFLRGRQTEGSIVRVSAPGRVHQEPLSDPKVFKPIGAVEVDHGNGWFTLYLHMRDIGVRKGQWLAQGAPIGIVSNVGVAGRRPVPHLHYEQLWDPGARDADNEDIQYPVIQGKRYALRAGDRFPSVTSVNACAAAPGPLVFTPTAYALPPQFGGLAHKGMRANRGASLRATGSLESLIGGPNVRTLAVCDHGPRDAPAAMRVYNARGSFIDYRNTTNEPCYTRGLGYEITHFRLLVDGTLSPPQTPPPLR